MELICSFVYEIDKMLNKKVGRKEKFKGKSIVISSRVPEESKLIYKILIDKTVSKLAKERGDLK